MYRSRKLLASRTLTGDKLEEALILVSGYDERERQGRGEESERKRDSVLTLPYLRYNL